MNEDLISLCLKEIEEKLSWVSSEDWQNQDFELLSDSIFEKSQVRLSVTTLKRVWGKVNHKGAPSVTTLNALAQFLDYQNWSDYRNQNTNDKSPKTVQSKHFPSKYLVSVGGLMILFMIIFGIAQLNSAGSTSSLDLQSITFSAQPVTKGLPNSVLFEYSYGSNEISEAQIQQSWNSRLTFDIDPTKNQATAFYYYPGYFQAKLLADGEIVKEQGLKVPTNGWMGTIDQDTRPRYLYDDELVKNNSLSITDKLLNEIKAKDNEEASLLTYHYFDELPEIYSNDFTFETRFLNNYNKSNGICKRVELLVHGETGVYLIPFSIAGCSSELDLINSGDQVYGKENDLSMFGLNTGEWINFKLEVENGLARYFVNNTQVFQKELVYNIGQLVGFKVRFEGSGKLDHIKLNNDMGATFWEDFNDPSIH